MSKPPTVVELLGQKFSIELVDGQNEDLSPSDADKRTVGRVRMSAQRILVADDLGPDQEPDTVLHEVLHCLFRLVNLQPDRAEEERVVMGLAPVLLDALRRNPPLVQYLTTPDPK